MKITVCKYDIPKEYILAIDFNRVVSLDIETSGLDWKNDKIATCQIFTPNRENEVIIVQIKENKKPEFLLCYVLENRHIRKIFHHVCFDLRFLCYNWKINPVNIICTKIASKILNKEKNSHRLNELLKKYLNVEIKKDQTKSDWFREELTEDQKRYGANDVFYLNRLFNVLKNRLFKENLLSLALSCFEHIPTRVQLEINNYPDVYIY